MNWKTSLSGVFAALLQLGKQVLPAEFHPVLDAASAFAIALLGYFAKDKSVH